MIFLSPPHMGAAELEYIKEAFSTNWIAPLGPQVDAFESEFAEFVGVKHALALSSGTAALHLALRLSGVAKGHQVLCSTLTFIASASPILYEGGEPVFIDATPDSWCIDPNLLEDEIVACRTQGRLPKAVVVVDVLGQSADHARILEICDRYCVTVLEDAAEALGATYQGRQLGRFGKFGVFSFNGNKIITTSGGGMLVSDDKALIERARWLASQARDPAPHYQHSEIGYNYRMSNILAAIGRGQLELLPERVEARRRIFERYRKSLGDLAGISFMPEAPYGRCTRWLTCLTIDPEAFGATREDVRLALEKKRIEARPVWKPLHLQPVFKGCRVRGGAVAERIFERGLCLPSGSSLSHADQDRIVEVIRRL